jgi:type VI protein secretion system component VasK
MEDFHALAALVLLVALAALAVYLYFLPFAIGHNRNVSTAAALFFVNLFLGWTVVGWLFCLLWAVIGASREQDEFYRRQCTGMPPCPPPASSST